MSGGINIFELITMVMFGAGWPISIARSVRTKASSGHGTFFYVTVVIGYTAGILHKVIYSLDYTLAIYIINLAMVIINMALSAHYDRLGVKESDISAKENAQQ